MHASNGQSVKLACVRLSAARGRRRRCLDTPYLGDISLQIVAGHATHDKRASCAIPWLDAVLCAVTTGHVSRSKATCLASTFTAERGLRPAPPGSSSPPQVSQPFFIEYAIFSHTKPILTVMRPSAMSKSG
ncbi:hypothetical protein EVAR_96806_1 [Eumeta japonica]|uniref:Uncharacterized protein n=1 Tax=Eumeta variegata TaxID=151549 RepID=A0A4C1WDK1_EUMVA|nr:hypothetical protein EVAR_96806_1 [Eumeta japonica]